MRRLALLSLLVGCSGAIEPVDAPLDDAADDARADDAASLDGGDDTTTARDSEADALDASSDATQNDTSTPDTRAQPDSAAIDVPAEAPCASGTSKVGDVYTIAVDGHTGDEATTEPKTDANDGKNGDIPAFRRTNVARAHTFGQSYWYTSKHVDTAGEPNPSGPQHVDYAPPLARLGAGRWAITMYYRQGDNRAPYPAVYEVHHAGGTTMINRDQRVGSDYTGFSLGTFDLGCAGYVRVKDTGSESISFGHMEMKYVGP